MEASYNSTNLLQSFYCPVSQKPLKKAVILLDCSHKINEVVAKRLYGNMEGERCATLSRLCPVLDCGQVVKFYKPDFHFRGIVEQFFGFDQEEKNLATLLKNISVRSLMELVPSSLFLYPKERETFALMEGDNSSIFKEESRGRYIYCKSIDKTDPLISEFKFHESKDGFFLLIIRFRPRDAKFVNYLEKSLNKKLANFEIERGYFGANTLEDLIFAYNMLVDYNDVPLRVAQHMYEFIQKLLQQRRGTVIKTRN